MFLEAEAELSDQYQVLTKAECVFAAIWNSPTGTVTTEAIAEYYQVTPDRVSDIVEYHHEELDDLELPEDGWTPRGAIRLGMLLDSPIAVSVRSLTLDIIEAHKQTNKKDAVRFLLENGQFVEWSNRAIAKILECHHKTVGDVRKRLEAENKIIPITRRKHNRMGKTIERNDNTTTQPENQGSSSLMATVAMSNPQTLILPSSKPDEPQPNTEVLPDAAPIPRRTPLSPKTYTEEELQILIERAINESKIGLKVKAEEDAIAEVKERLIAANAIADKAKSENIDLQQKIIELESFRLLEEENKRLLRRIADLERSLSDRGTGWGNTFTKQAEKVVNAEVAASVKRVEQLEPELHLRALAINPPTENQTSVVRLLGLSLEATAQSMPKFAAELRKAAAIILQVDENSLEKRAFQLRQLPEAIASIKSVLTLPDIDWVKFTQVSDNYGFIKQEIWMGLNPQEREKINQLKSSTPNSPLPTPPSFIIGSKVLIADPFSTRAKIPGTVIGIENEMFLIHWGDCDQPLFQHRYESDELRLVEVAA